ncbi:MAG: hypothetical protein AAGH72_00025 [Verrucomicrobiota bacterium]
MTLTQKSWISMGHFALSILIQATLLYSYMDASWGGVGGRDYRIWEILTWIINPLSGLAWYGLVSNAYGLVSYFFIALLATLLGTFILAVFVEFFDRYFVLNLFKK